MSKSESGKINPSLEGSAHQNKIVPFSKWLLWICIFLCFALNANSKGLNKTEIAKIIQEQNQLKEKKKSTQIESVDSIFRNLKLPSDSGVCLIESSSSNLCYLTAFDFRQQFYRESIDNFTSIRLNMDFLHMIRLELMRIIEQIFIASYHETGLQDYSEKPVHKNPSKDVRIEIIFSTSQEKLNRLGLLVDSLEKCSTSIYSSEIAVLPDSLVIQLIENKGELQSTKLLGFFAYVNVYQGDLRSVNRGTFVNKELNYLISDSLRSNYLAQNGPLYAEDTLVAKVAIIDNDKCLIKNYGMDTLSLTSDDLKSIGIASISDSARDYESFIGNLRIVPLKWKMGKKLSLPIDDSILNRMIVVENFGGAGKLVNSYLEEKNKAPSVYSWSSILGLQNFENLEKSPSHEILKQEKKRLLLNWANSNIVIHDSLLELL